MKINIKYKRIVLVFSFAPTRTRFASTTGGDLLRKPINSPLNGVAEVHKPMLETF